MSFDVKYRWPALLGLSFIALLVAVVAYSRIYGIPIHEEVSYSHFKFKLSNEPSTILYESKTDDLWVIVTLYDDRVLWVSIRPNHDIEDGIVNSSNAGNIYDKYVDNVNVINESGDNGITSVDGAMYMVEVVHDRIGIIEIHHRYPIGIFRIYHVNNPKEVVLSIEGNEIRRETRVDDKNVKK